MANAEQLIVRDLGMRDYEPVWQAMTAFTNDRGESTTDEFWLVQHPPVFTQGQAGKAEHVLAAGDIPVVQVDRGGQVTYHGPGQQVVYVLLNVRRKGFGVRELVSSMEKALVKTLSEFGIESYPREDAPGVYVKITNGIMSGEAKIAALGLRIRKGCSFHGLSLNVDMDLSPFQRINPCGYAGMAVTQMRDMMPAASSSPDIEAICKSLITNLAELTDYSEISYAGNTAGLPDTIKDQLSQEASRDEQSLEEHNSYE
ncbi:lipoyl(octanoyl) transferase LipB [Parendozoicomonas haliclonae]|uniref:Octanoyltransferase n=1 Tax=Parendozoicomonas haliclonae TaxID=1960125 RepID=A0A1X7AJ69_9GAMM|nr:lipoyl(octanoyl) transferase LipB [Parendozoicomonas haliclonae]SMA40391.1 Octanoyltransferase [Parendozoicomonas haliclonae]